MKQAVLLLAHGAPERVEDVAEYLLLVRGGRPMPPHIIHEIEQRYAAIGGGSPLHKHTRAQAEALQIKLPDVSIYYAMRNWQPIILDVMKRMQEDGVERIVAVCLAPQYSRMSVGFYFRRVQEAKQTLGMNAEIVWTKSFHDHPALICAFTEKLQEVGHNGKVLFTAHSLPEKILENNDPYDTEVKTTARLVAEAAGITDWEFAYQSQGASDEKWLGPSVESCLDRYAAAGVKQLVLHPIGFVCDHVEVLYDVDVLFKNYARERGIELVRPGSLNDSAAFIGALAGVSSQRLI
jgi:ferrochelatase